MKIKRLVLLIVVSCFLLSGIISGILIYYAQRSPEAYYRQAKGLQKKAFDYLEETGYKKHGYDLALKKYKEALTKFELIEKDYPAWKESHKSLFDSAREDCLKWIERMEAMPKLDAATSYFEVGKYEDALKAYNAFVIEYKDRVPHLAALAQTYIGSIYLKMGRYEDAINAYNTVLDNYKGADQSQRNYSGMALAGIGKVYAEMGRYKEAQEVYQRVITEYSEFPYAKMLKLMFDLMPIESWSQMRQTYGDKGVSVIQGFLIGHTSENEFKSFLIKENKGDSFLLGMGLKLQLKGDLDGAKKYYKKYIATSKKQDEVYNLAVKALEKIEGK